MTTLNAWLMVDAHLLSLLVVAVVASIALIAAGPAAHVMSVRRVERACLVPPGRHVARRRAGSHRAAWRGVS